MQPRPLTQDECRRTLRRLELDAYASLVSVLRAQGALGAERRAVLESARRALHIGADRHAAEARRASNDELLAAIADQVSGPNTGLGWIKEGRRKIPILPRGIPQTIYTAIADKAAAKALEENQLIAQKKYFEQQSAIHGSPQTPADVSEEEIPPLEASVVDDKCSFKNKKNDYPPVVMCDQSLKMLNDDGPPRKRSRSDMTVIPHRMTHQKHHNLSQIYNNYSKHSGKMSNQYGRNSYNQSGKMGIKSNHANLNKAAISKHRSIQKHGSGNKHCGNVAIPHHQVRSGIKSPTDPHIVGSQALCMQNQMDANNMKSQTPSYQANYVQPSVQNVKMDDPNNEIKMSVGSTMLTESPAMQMSNQTLGSHDVSASLPVSSEDSSDISTSMHAQLLASVASGIASAPKMQTSTARPCHIIIKNKHENSVDPGKKIQITNKQVISKQDLSSIKVLQNRPLVVASPNNNSQKLLNSSGKLITTKIVQHIPAKSQPHLTNIISQAHVTNAQVLDKVLVMPKSPTVQSNILQRSVNNTPLTNVYLSANSPMINPKKEGDVGPPVKSIDGDVSSKNVIINSDVKLPTKTFLFNSKSGQKMVVLPAKARTKTLSGPLLHVKSVQGKPAMKLIPVSGQNINSQSKSNTVTVLSKTVNPNVLATPTKIISKELLNPLKPNVPSGDGSVSVSKVLAQVQITPKNINLQQPAKGNVIVVQKGKTPITLKGGAEFKHIAANKVVIDHQAETPFPPESVSTESQEPVAVEKSTDVFFMELNNETSTDKNITYESEGCDETINESNPDIKMDSSMITEDTPVLFHSQVSDECNTDSVESVNESMLETSHMDSTLKSESSYSETPSLLDGDKSDAKIMINQTAALSSFTDWEAELANAADKQSDGNKIGELNLELEMSSDSEAGSYTRIQKADKECEDASQDENEDTNEMYVQHSSISFASRTLLSQLQDDGSSSNDSPFVLTKNLDAGRLELLESSQTSSSAME